MLFSTILYVKLNTEINFLNLVLLIVCPHEYGPCRNHPVLLLNLACIDFSDIFSRTKVVNKFESTHIITCIF